MVCVKCVASGPARVILLKVSGALPWLVTLIVFAALEVPTACSPNASRGVFVASFGPLAVPLRRTVAGALIAAPVTTTAPDLSPADRGLNVTLMSQDLPAARVLPHSCLRVKSNGSLPEGRSGPRLKSALPVLLRVIRASRANLICLFRHCREKERGEFRESYASHAGSGAQLGVCGDSCVRG